MNAPSLSSRPLAGAIRLKDVLDGDVAYDYSLNLAQVVSLHRAVEGNIVERTSGPSFYITDADADALLSAMGLVP